MTASDVSRRATLAAAVKLGLTADEYEHICEIQEREPTYVELAIYSLMWSEHCSYKHSRPVLGRFPTSGPRILQGPGENAGIIDVGDGWAVAMKVESHNHPSAVEPFQGAATGVGGIVRDIFTMGARPVREHGLAALRRARPSRASASCSTASSAASPTTATASASPPSAARSTSSPATRATAWSTP